VHVRGSKERLAIKEIPDLQVRQASRAILETKETLELRAPKAIPVQVAALLWWYRLRSNPGHG
jgi:hypothetical protein